MGSCSPDSSWDGPGAARAAGRRAAAALCAAGCRAGPCARHRASRAAAGLAAAVLRRLQDGRYAVLTCAGRLKRALRRRLAEEGLRRSPGRDGGRATVPGGLGTCLHGQLLAGQLMGWTRCCILPGTSWPIPAPAGHLAAAGLARPKRLQARPVRGQAGPDVEGPIYMRGLSTGRDRCCMRGRQRVPSSIN